MALSGSSAAQRYARNLEVLQPFLPPVLHAELTQLSDPMLPFVGTVGEPGFNIGDETGQPYYQPDEVSYRRDFLERFKAQPTYLFELAGRAPIYPENSDPFVNLLTRKLEQDVLARVGASYREPERPGRAGYFVLLGGGLGLQVEEIVDGYDFADLILCEDNIVLFHASLFVCDWGRITGKLAERDGRLFFVLGEAPADFVGQIAEIVQQRHQALSEGALVALYHPTPAFRALAAGLDDLRQLCGQFNGWFSDELVHFRNSIANLSNGSETKRVLCTSGVDAKHNAPAIVVGSGPSLDDDLEQLKALSAGSVIISCGSALEALLAAGIAPDFHCELENVRSVSDIVSGVADRFDLSGITLLASTTVDASLPALFDRVLYFLREGDAMSAVIRGRFPVLPFSGRTAVCSAVSFASHIGCGTVATVGVDLAFNEDRHHADAVSVYASGRYGLGSAKSSGELECEGNFRPTVRTNGVWTFMRKGLEQVAMDRAADTRFLNCSNGARIAGFEPARLHELAATGAGMEPVPLMGLLESEGFLLEPAKVLEGIDPHDHVQTVLSAWSELKRDVLPRYGGKGDAAKNAFSALYRICAENFLMLGDEPEPPRVLFGFFLKKALFALRTRLVRVPLDKRDEYQVLALEAFEAVGDAVLMELVYQITRAEEMLGRPPAEFRDFDAAAFDRYARRRDGGLNSFCSVIVHLDLDAGEFDTDTFPERLDLPYPVSVDDVRRIHIDDFLRECHRRLRERPCEVCGNEVSWNIYPGSVNLEAGCRFCGATTVYKRDPSR